MDTLVNNAGIQSRRPMVELDALDGRQVIETNRASAFHRTQGSAAHDHAQTGRKHQHRLGSGAHARATVAPCTTSKGGFKPLIQAMEAEWAEHGIQANAIGPGNMPTNMNQALAEDPAVNAWVVARNSARRWDRPEGLVPAAVLLASAASDYVNSQIIYVDDGMLAVPRSMAACLRRAAW